MSHVIGIIAGTAYEDTDKFVEICQGYSESYWRKDPKLGLTIAYALNAADAIVQPRLLNKDMPEIYNGHWLQLNPNFDASTTKNIHGRCPIMQEIDDGQKIKAIKLLKDQTGLNLLQSRVAVERLMKLAEEAEADYDNTRKVIAAHLNVEHKEEKS